MKTALIDTAWYNKLVEDIKKHTIIKIVEAKHYLGRKVLKAKEEHEAEYGDYFIEQLAEDLQISRAEIYQCIQLYQKYPELSDTIRQLSWY